MPLYRLPSPNCCIVLRDGTRVLSHDGLIDTTALADSHPGIDEYMQDMVRVRNAWPVETAAIANAVKTPVAVKLPSIVPKAQPADPLQVHAASADSLMNMFNS